MEKQWLCMIYSMYTVHFTNKLQLQFFHSFHWMTCLHYTREILNTYLHVHYIPPSNLQKNGSRCQLPVLLDTANSDAMASPSILFMSVKYALTDKLSTVADIILKHAGKQYNSKHINRPKVQTEQQLQLVLFNWPSFHLRTSQIASAKI